jgi:hypothetical protein
VHAGVCCQAEKQQALAAACAANLLPKLSSLRRGMQRAFMSEFPELHALNPLTNHSAEDDQRTTAGHRELLGQTLKVCHQSQSEGRTIFDATVQSRA